MRDIYIPILAFAILTSCATTKQERRMNRATKKLERLTTKFPELLQPDTIRTIVTTERVEVDTVLQWQRDTIRIEKENLRVEIVRLAGDSVYVRAECDTVFVPVEIPVEVIKPVRYEVPARIQEQMRWCRWIIVGLFVLLVLALMKAIRK